MRTEDSPKNTPGLRLVGEEDNGYVWKNFGPVRAGLTTGRRTHDPALEELLRSWERNQMTLESKYSEVLDTLESAIKILVRLTNSISGTTIIEKDGKSVVE